MPYNSSNNDHFKALEREMGDQIGDSNNSFMRDEERVDFFKSLHSARIATPNLNVPTPTSKDSNAYVCSDPCKECSLWTVSHAAANGLTFWRSGLYGRGTGKNGLYIVGDAPAAFEIVNGKFFSGAPGTILSSALKKAGIVEEDCFTTGVIRCRPDGNRNLKVVEVDFCQDVHFKHDLPQSDWRPKLVLVLGLQALKHMMKMQKLATNRGIFFDTEFIDTPCKFIATYHPSMILLKPELFSDFQGDIDKAAQYITGSEVTLPPISSSLISTQRGYMRWMDFLLEVGDPINLSVDVETTGLNYLEDNIVSIAITHFYNNKYYGFSFLTDHEDTSWWQLDLNNRDSLEFQVLKTVLEKNYLTFQGGDFDVKFFWKLGINCVNWCDTMDAHLMIEERPPHNLEYFVKKYIGEGAGYKGEFREGLEDKSSFRTAEPSKLLQYNLDDTYYTYLLRNIFLEKIQDENLGGLFWDHAMPLQRTLSRMSYRGLRVNREVLMSLASDNRAQIQRLMRKLHAEVGDFSLTPESIRDLLYNKLKLPILKTTEKTSLPSTDKDVLGLLALSHHIPKMILEVKQLAKQNSTYLDGDDGLPKSVNSKVVKGILQFLDKNNRVHPHFFPWGTVSGRLSASRPNVLNVPKKSVFRSLFIPSDGYVYVDADYSQAELIVLAYLCGDKNLIQAVNSSDLHTKVVVDLLGISVDDPKFSESRRIAKTINFGKVYGAGPKKLVEQLKFNPEGSIIISQEEAEGYHNKWNNMYPGVQEWSNAQHTFWRQDLELVSIFGRKMRFPDLSELRDIPGQKDNVRTIESEKDRLCTNFPPQSAVGDATNRALRLIDKELEKEYGKWTPENCMNRPAPVLSLHDEVLLEVPEGEISKISQMLYDIMLLPLPKLGIRLKVEMETKVSWGDKGTKLQF